MYATLVDVALVNCDVQRLILLIMHLCDNQPSIYCWEDWISNALWLHYCGNRGVPW